MAQSTNRISIQVGKQIIKKHVVQVVAKSNFTFRCDVIIEVKGKILHAQMCRSILS